MQTISFTNPSYHCKETQWGPSPWVMSHQDTLLTPSPKTQYWINCYKVLQMFPRTLFKDIEGLHFIALVKSQNYPSTLKWALTVSCLFIVQYLDLGHLVAFLKINFYIKLNFVTPMLAGRKLADYTCVILSEFKCFLITCNNQKWL